MGDHKDSWLTQLNGNIINSIPARDIPTIMSSVASLFIVWFLGSCIWYRYLSPISDIPGPFLASFSRLWLIQSLLRGKSATELSELHEKHGK